jgi:hypothetical protein
VKQLKDNASNPFTPVEFWTETVIRQKSEDSDERKEVPAKHYHIRYLVGESADKSYVDAGDSVEPVEDTTKYVVSSIHKMTDDVAHYNVDEIKSVRGRKQLSERWKALGRVDHCAEHELVEISYESPGVECCDMTKDEADKQKIPLKYMSGYLLGKSDKYLKIALTKTAMESGDTYYGSIHVIPEAVVREITCLE